MLLSQKWAFFVVYLFVGGYLLSFLTSFLFERLRSSAPLFYPFLLVLEAFSFSFIAKGGAGRIHRLALLHPTSPFFVVRFGAASLSVFQQFPICSPFLFYLHLLSFGLCACCCKTWFCEEKRRACPSVCCLLAFWRIVDVVVAAAEFCLFCSLYHWLTSIARFFVGGILILNRGWAEEKARWGKV